MHLRSKEMHQSLDQKWHCRRRQRQYQSRRIGFETPLPQSQTNRANQRLEQNGARAKLYLGASLRARNVELRRQHSAIQRMRTGSPSNRSKPARPRLLHLQSLTSHCCYPPRPQVEERNQSYILRRLVGEGWSYKVRIRRRRRDLRKST
jgi:hypothetical protein